MDFRIKNLPQFEAELTNLIKQKIFAPKIMDAVTEAAIKIIRERTREGLDIQNSPFRPYSTKPCYFSTNSKYNADRKAPSGGAYTKTHKSMYFSSGYAQYQGHKPNLDNLGLMLNSMTYRREGDNKRIIYFSSAGNRKITNSALANVHNEGLGKNPKREFFGIKRQEEMNMLKAVWERLANAK